MTASTMTTEPNTSHPKKTKVDKMQSYMGLASTTIGVLGAVGTAFVWLATNVFTGGVDIKTDKPVETVMVKVIDQKGQQATYYSKHISLLPGKYHLEVGIPDKQPTQHMDATVQLWANTTLPYAVPDLTAAAVSATASDQPNTPPATAKKHWWQFWKHHSTTDATTSDAQK